MSLLRTDWKIGERHDPAQRGSGKIDLPRMKEGGLDAEFFAAFVGQGPLTPEAYAKAKDSAAAGRRGRPQDDRGVRLGLIGLAVDPAGARRLKKEGKLTAFIGLENGYPIGRDLSLIEALPRPGRPLHHPLPFLRQRHLRFLDRPPQPRGQGPERLRPPGRGRVQPVGHDRRHLARFGKVVLRCPRRFQGPDHRLPLERPGRLRQSPQPDRRPAPGPGQERRRHPDLLPRAPTSRRRPSSPSAKRPSRSSRPSTARSRRDPRRCRPGQGHGRARRHQQAVPPGPPDRRRPRRPHRPRQEGRRHRLRRDRHRLRRRRRGGRLRRRQRHDPRDRGAHPPRLHRPGDRQDLGRELLPGLRQDHGGRGEVAGVRPAGA
ncbi:MAG: membrane dipeptidase [Marinilabiliales bacterium]|nr:membrane dipeptidase [Marinilabiliales bacterium]